MSKWYEADWLRMTAFILMVIGALNWGLVTWFDFNLVAQIAAKTMGWVGTLIYNLVAVSGAYSLWQIKEYI